MTAEKLDRMTDAELDKLAAERVMGWNPVFPREDDNFWRMGEGVKLGSFKPTTSIADAFALQAEIMRREMTDKFAHELTMIAAYHGAFSGSNDPQEWEHEWLLANATAKQRTCAAILAIAGAGH